MKACRERSDVSTEARESSAKAIESRPRTLDCSSRSLSSGSPNGETRGRLEMTVKHALSSSRPLAASECCSSRRPLRNEGAGKAGHRLMPVARLRKKCRRQEPQVQPDDPAFPARWLYGLYELSPGTGFLAPVIRALVKLAAQIWHQHRDARTTRLRRAHRIVRRHDRSRCNPTRPPHPAPNARDDRETPLDRGGMKWR